MPMFKGSAFLIKVLTISGASGGPIIFYGLPSTDSEGQRQFKGSIDGDLTKVGEKFEVDKKEGNLIENLTKERGQGVSRETGKKLSGSEGRSVYKLALRSLGIQNEDEVEDKKSIKGALGLVRIGWKPAGGGGIASASMEERVEVVDSDKVGLIIAKGQNSIYLIPVVRSSAPWSDPETTKKMKDRSDTKKVGLEGIKDIGQGAEEFDKSEEWKKERNDQLLKSFKTGFGIVRNGSFVFKKSEKLVEVRREG